MMSKRKRVAEKKERLSKTLKSCRFVAQCCSTSARSLNAIDQFEQSLQARYTLEQQRPPSEVTSAKQGSPDTPLDVHSDSEKTAKAPATTRQQGVERDANASTRIAESEAQYDSQGGRSSSSNSENPSHSDFNSAIFARDHDEEESRTSRTGAPILPDMRESAGSAIEETDPGNNMTGGKSGDNDSNSDSQAKDDASDSQVSKSSISSGQELEMQCGGSISSLESDGKIRGATMSTTDIAHDTSAASDAEDTDYIADVCAEIEKIRHSKLSITLQGLRSNGRLREQPEDDHRHSNSGTATESRDDYSQRDRIIFQGNEIHKGRCYRYREKVNGRELDAIVGIRQFLPGTMAETILIIPFEETFLGMTDDESLFQASFKPANHVQVEDTVINAPLEYLSDEYLPVIPDLIYEPQTPGSWHQFSYYRANAKKRKGLRREYRLLDFFAGCGGMSMGFENCNFELVKAIEKDSIAAETFTSNHKNAPMVNGDVNVFLSTCEKDIDYRKRLRRTDHVHVSAPCQGFSGANRIGGRNDKANNDLSLTFTNAVRIADSNTASYENVLGLWKRKHIHYLKRICVELMKLNYQVRCAFLHVCDYGDPSSDLASFYWLPSRLCTCHPCQ